MKYIQLLTMICLICSCNAWLDVNPENERLSADYWTKKEDVHNVMMSAYSRLRDCHEKMFQWGELRADVLELNTTNLPEDMAKMNKQNIITENSIVKWNNFYNVINAANSVIEYAQLVVDRDPLFTEDMMDRYVAEAKAMRSLVYFYLVRSFSEVPFVTSPYMTDSQGLLLAKSNEKEILNYLILDLKWALKRIPVSYEINSSTKWQNKGRINRWAAQALLADIYLWCERYNECIEACDLIVASGRYRLLAVDTEEEEDELSQESWLNIFYPGLSDESIFELFYDHANGQTNKLASFFQKNGRFIIPQRIVDQFEANDELDARGKNKSYFKSDTWQSVWKFIGAKPDGTTQRSSDKRSANWIIYRYADVLLIQAEAYALSEGGLSLSNKEKSINLLNQIKSRAKITQLVVDEAVQMSTDMLLKEIFEERKKEFIGEGKRWYDLVRLAKKEDFSLYKKMVIDIMLENIPVNERTIYETKLSNKWSFFFPIHKDEIDLGKGLLIQNPAYIK